MAQNNLLFAIDMTIFIGLMREENETEEDLYISRQYKEKWIGLISPQPKMVWSNF